RFTQEASKSPEKPAATIQAQAARVCATLIVTSGRNNTAIKAAKSKPPKAPSTVFPGLTLWERGCLPNMLPTTWLNPSNAATTKYTKTANSFVESEKKSSSARARTK